MEIGEGGIYYCEPYHRIARGGLSYCARRASDGCAERARKRKPEMNAAQIVEWGRSITCARVETRLLFPWCMRRYISVETDGTLRAIR
jgi:hypothetical protein